jgi:hypothetical protein
MRSNALLIIAALCAGSILPGCGDGADATNVEPVLEEKPEMETRDRPGAIAGREFAEVSADEIQPSFSPETVTKLNEIVRRSQQAATTYAGSIKGVRAAVAAAAASRSDETLRTEAEMRLAELSEINDAARRAAKDMNAAVTALKTSGEAYNEIILSGMMKYVADVDAATSSELRALRNELDGA